MNDKTLSQFFFFLNDFLGELAADDIPYFIIFFLKYSILFFIVH